MKFIWVVFIIFLASTQISLVSQYPAYQYWDMDHTTMIDLLLLRSHIMPDHMAHPGFGLNLILNWAYEVMSWFRFMPVDSIQELKTSLNPILVASETTVNLRYFFSLLNIVTATLFAFSMINIFKTKTRTSFLVFAAFATQVWIAILSPVVRTEPAVLFFVALSLYCISFTSANQTKKNLFLACAASFFAGIALLTKVQALGYIVILPLIYVLVLDLKRASLPKLSLPQEKKALNFLLSFFILILIGLLAYELPKNIENFRHSMTYPSGVSAFILIALLALITINRSAFLREHKLIAPLKPTLQFLPIYIACIFVALLAPMITTSNLLFNFDYTLALSKTLLFGKIISHVLSDTKLSLEILINRCLSFGPWTLLNVSLLCFCVFRWIKEKSVSKAFYRTATIILSVSLLVFAVIVRNIWRQDIVWYEPLIVWIAICIALHSKAYKTPWAFLGLTIVFQLVHFFGYQNYTTFSDREEFRLFNQVYGNNQAQYTDIINHKLAADNPEIRVNAAKQARQVQDIKSKFSHIFVNRKTELKNIFPLTQGMPADTTNDQVFIDSVSKNLNGLHTIQVENSPESIGQTITSKLKLEYLKSTRLIDNQTTLRALKDVRAFLFIEGNQSAQFQRLNPSFKLLAEEFKTQDRSNGAIRTYAAFSAPASDVSVDFTQVAGAIYLSYQDEILIQK